MKKQLLLILILMFSSCGKNIKKQYNQSRSNIRAINANADVKKLDKKLIAKPLPTLANNLKKTINVTPLKTVAYKKHKQAIKTTDEVIIEEAKIDKSAIVKVSENIKSEIEVDTVQKMDANPNLAVALEIAQEAVLPAVEAALQTTQVDLEELPNIEVEEDKIGKYKANLGKGIKGRRKPTGNPLRKKVAEDHEITEEQESPIEPKIDGPIILEEDNKVKEETISKEDMIKAATEGIAATLKHQQM